MDNYMLRTVISGSYGKHFGQMIAIKKFLQGREIIVQAPVSEESSTAHRTRSSCSMRIRD